MKKIILVVTILCFMASNVSFAFDARINNTSLSSMNLAANYATDDMIPGDRTLGMINLQMYLKLIAEDSSQVPADEKALKKAFRKIAKRQKTQLTNNRIKLRHGGSQIYIYPAKLEFVTESICRIPISITMSGKEPDNFSLLFSITPIETDSGTVYPIMPDTDTALKSLRKSLATASNKNPVESPLLKFRQINQKIWLDGLTWEMIKTGEFEQLVKVHNITGVTTNPSLIKAYLKDREVLAKVAELAGQGLSQDDIYFEIIKELALSVIAVFKKCGVDGKFSVELNPEKADDVDASIVEGVKWTAIDPKHMMVKVAATEAGYNIIEELTALGRNVNATLIFTSEQYREVAEAYIRGLKRAQTAGIDISKVYSVASFFVSRWDVKLKDAIPAELHGKVANAVATRSYGEIFKTIFESQEFKGLKANGARVQDFLLASTGTKRSTMPEDFQEKYPDDIYITPVMGPNVVNTLPYAAIKHMIENGVEVSPTIIENNDDAKSTISQMRKIADMDETGKTLFSDGMASFVKDFGDIMNTIDDAIAEAKGPSRDDEGRFTEEDGKSPEATMAVIALSDFFRMSTDTQRTLGDYKKAYEAVRNAYPELKLDSLAKYWRTTALADLHALVERGILRIVNPDRSGSEPYKFSLSNVDTVSEISRLRVKMKELIRRYEHPTTNRKRKDNILSLKIDLSYKIILIDKWNIETIPQLKDFNYYELTSTPGIGVYGARHIFKALDELGIDTDYSLGVDNKSVASALHKLLDGKIRPSIDSNHSFNPTEIASYMTPLGKPANRHAQSLIYGGVNSSFEVAVRRYQPATMLWQAYESVLVKPEIQRLIAKGRTKNAAFKVIDAMLAELEITYELGAEDVNKLYAPKNSSETTSILNPMVQELLQQALEALKNSGYEDDEKFFMDHDSLRRALEEIGMTFEKGFDEKSALVLTQRAAFGEWHNDDTSRPGLAILFRKPAAWGIQTAVIAKTDEQKALIIELNKDRPDDQKIILADSPEHARLQIGSGKTYYYLHVEGDDMPSKGFIPQNVTSIVDKIIEALGRVCNLTEQKFLDKMRDAALLFAHAA